MNYTFIFYLFLLCFTHQGVSQHKKTFLPLTQDAWEFPKNNPPKFEFYNGKQAMFLNSKAFLKDFEFKNGTIEVAIAANKKRSFAGFIFRKNKRHGEEVYLRMHKSRMPDGLQYTPIFNNESNWQLYHQLQQTTVLKDTGWNTLKIVVYEQQAIVFVNETKLLDIAELRSGNLIGRLGFFALFGNWFADLTYTPGVDTSLFPVQTKKSVIDKSLIQSWQLSKVYPTTILQQQSLLQLANESSFTSFKTETNGLLPISKYRSKISSGAFERNKEEFVIAKLIIHSEKKQIKKINIDFSDKLHFYLNKELLFEGDNSFRSKGPQYMGHLGLKNNTLILNLEKGSNEILCVVTEKANGWGLLAKLNNLDFIQLMP